jgi:hypothetical protein
MPAANALDGAWMQWAASLDEGRKYSALDLACECGAPVGKRCTERDKLPNLG